MFKDLYIKARGGITPVNPDIDKHFISASSLVSAHQKDEWAGKFIEVQPDGNTNTNFSTLVGFNNAIFCVLRSIVSAGKVYLGGTFINFQGSSILRIIRLNSDGSRDTTFNSVIGIGANSDVNAIVEQTDGKIIIGGNFTNYNGTNINRIVRLNTNGSIDNTFTVGSGFDVAVTALALQTDGKVVVGGNFTTYNGVSRNRICRLNSDGTLDNTIWTSGTGFNSFVRKIVIQPDGKYLVGGDYTTYQGVARSRIVRLNTDATVDTSFAVGSGGFNGPVLDIKLLSDGKMYVCGSFTTYQSQAQNRIVKLDAFANRDLSFNVGTGIGSSNVRAIDVLSDNRVVAGGDFQSVNGLTQNRLVMFNTNGSVDNSFNSGTGPSFSNVHCLSVNLSNNNIFVGGDFDFYKRLSDVFSQNVSQGVSYNKDGDINYASVFAKNANTMNASANIMKQTADNKIVMGGGFNTYQGNLAFRLMRINMDGTLDRTFDTRTGFDNVVRTVEFTSDNKIIVGGDFSFYKGQVCTRLIRLNQDASIDSTFLGLFNFNNNVFSIATQSDNKIIVGGAFTTHNSITRNRIVRINSDGTFDNTFNIGTGFNNAVQKIQVLKNGKILVAGGFTEYNGNSVGYICVLNSDGTLDTTFNLGGAGFNNNAITFKVLDNDKIIVGGAFTSYNGITHNRIIRLNSDGSVDNTFDVGAGIPSGQVTCLDTQSDGKIILGGNFNSYNNNNCNLLCRISENGTFDMSYKALIITSSTISDILVIK